MKTIWVSWSSGKDSAWTLLSLKNKPNHKITGIVTTLNMKRNRVAMHSTRYKILQAQAAALHLPLYTIKIPEPCSNIVYETKMKNLIIKAKNNAVTHMAFGDLFLKDVRQYREDSLKESGIEPIFPLWKTPTDKLAIEMIAGGLKAIVSCVDTKHLSEEFVGREYNEEFLSDLPANVDPCGENGEFHTCVYAGPFFQDGLKLKIGKIHHSDQFCFVDMRIKVYDTP